MTRFFFFFSPLLLLLLSLISLSSSTTTTTMVFRGCSTQKFTSSSTSLQNLLSSLSSQSSSAKFRRSSAGDLSGLFQCRADLSQSDCADCVGKIPKLITRFCPDSVASRVQLAGCYIGYESSGFGQIPDTQFLYKVCGSRQASEPGFRSLLGSALGEIVKGVNGTGYYAGDYESVNFLGQCEGDLGKSDCVDCVTSAVDRAENDCGSSISGQIYLQKCYISYNYYSKGVTVESGSSGGSGKNTQKIVAIVVGSVAGFGLLIAALLFLKSAFKKKNTKY